MLFPQARRCPFTHRMSLVAPGRAARPMALEHSEPHHRDGNHRKDCPFCPGAEHDTPNPVLTLTEDGQWILRVVPNKFPAVGTQGPAVGLHEVLIECREHESNPTKLSPRQFARVFQCYRDRLKAHADDPRLGCTCVFKNVGAEAGASLSHSHSQLIALPEVPDAIRHELDLAQAYHRQHGRCRMCVELNKELDDGSRLIGRTEHFAAFAAFAPRFAYEFWVAPLSHAGRYESASDHALAELAGFIQRLLRALDRVALEPAYNLLLHTEPLHSAGEAGFHWHWECLPRTARVAGFEWGSGAYIVAVTPERAAAEMRTALD
jgi:UDPglucose--hexose-1-phosphate uridylyltransferase